MLHYNFAKYQLLFVDMYKNLWNLLLILNTFIQFGSLNFAVLLFDNLVPISDMWQCPVKKIGLVHGPVKGYSLQDQIKRPVGIWAPPLWSMWMSCKLDAESSNSCTGLIVHSSSIYLGTYCYIQMYKIHKNMYSANNN